MERNNTPIAKLSKQELIGELSTREIYAGNRRDERENCLSITEELHGIQRVPELLFHTLNKGLETINCKHYEILPFEPLHDIGKHIENIFQELPHHLERDQAKPILDVLDVSLNGKDTKRTLILTTDVHWFRYSSIPEEKFLARLNIFLIGLSGSNKLPMPQRKLGHQVKCYGSTI
jgi:hypothetical protein